jgi:hypothetical protein
LHEKKTNTSNRKNKWHENKKKSVSRKNFFSHTLNYTKSSRLHRHHKQDMCYFQRSLRKYRGKHAKKKSEKLEFELDFFKKRVSDVPPCRVGLRFFFRKITTSLLRKVEYIIFQTHTVKTLRKWTLNFSWKLFFLYD